MPHRIPQPKNWDTRTGRIQGYTGKPGGGHPPGGGGNMVLQNARHETKKAIKYKKTTKKTKNMQFLKELPRYAQFSIGEDSKQGGGDANPQKTRRRKTQKKHAFLQNHKNNAKN